MEKSKKQKKQRPEGALPLGAVITIIIACVLAAALFVWAVVMAIISAVEMNRDALNYLEDDLSPYISVDPMKYKDYDIEIDIPDVSELEIEDAILKVLADNKGETKYDGEYVLNKPIGAGDKAYIWYRGYEIHESGVQIDLDGTSNFSEASETVLTIGSGQFVPGFELGLVGKIASETGADKFNLITKGTPTDTDVLYLTATYVEEVGSNIGVEKKIRIDLRDPNIEKVWGVGIREQLLSMSIGISDFDRHDFIKSGTDDMISFTYLKIENATRFENTPATVKAVFPYDYSSAELRGKTVYFDVYIDKVLHYETATLDDAFIKDKLKLSEEKLAEYAGGTLVDKYRSYVKAGLDKEREELKDIAAEEEMWKYLKETFKVKKLPNHEVQRVFDDYYYNFQMQYAQGYTNYYESIDAYILNYFGLEEGDDWQATLNKQVEGEITEKLIFFSILKKENLLLSDEQYNEVYKRELTLDYEYYTGKSRDDFATDEEYNAAVAAYESEMLASVGAEQYRETVYYIYASDIILSYAHITNKAE